MLFVIHEITHIADISCIPLQCHGLLLCNQHYTLKRLVLVIISKVGIDGRFSEVQRGAIVEATHERSDSGEYTVSLAAIRGFMEDLGFFIKECIVAMDNDICDMLLRLPVSEILELVNVISVVVAERAEDSGTHLDAATSVLPNQLVYVLPRHFSHPLQRHRQRLEVTFSIEEIKNIERLHKALCESYCLQRDVKRSINSLDDGAAYRASWRALQHVTLAGKVRRRLSDHFTLHVDQ